jgi:hypothetical protein
MPDQDTRPDARAPHKPSRIVPLGSWKLDPPDSGTAKLDDAKAFVDCGPPNFVKGE